jgi:hypothetical protein
MAAALLIASAANVAFQGCDSPSSPSSACQYAVAPATFASCMAGGFDLVLQVSTTSKCAWTASASDPWITLTSQATGVGTGAVHFRISDNWDAPRQGAVTVQGTQLKNGASAVVSQAGCLYAVTQDTFLFGSSGGQGVFDVLQQSVPVECGGPLQDACRWSAVADAPWIAVTTAMPRTGDDRVTFIVAPSDGAERTGTIAVRDKTVRVTQR